MWHDPWMSHQVRPPTRWRTYHYCGPLQTKTSTKSMHMYGRKRYTCISTAVADIHDPSWTQLPPKYAGLVWLKQISILIYSNCMRARYVWGPLWWSETSSGDPVVSVYLEGGAGSPGVWMWDQPLSYYLRPHNTSCVNNITLSMIYYQHQKLTFLSYNFQ